MNLIVYCWDPFYIEINSLRTCLSFSWLVKDPRVVSSYLIPKEIYINPVTGFFEGPKWVSLNTFPKEMPGYFWWQKTPKPNQTNKKPTQKTKAYQSQSENLNYFTLSHTNWLKKGIWWFKPQKFEKQVLYSHISLIVVKYGSLPPRHLLEPIFNWNFVRVMSKTLLSWSDVHIWGKYDVTELQDQQYSQYLQESKITEMQE